MDFKTFISGYAGVDGPMGDFAKDVSRAKDFPDKEQTHERLNQYFEYQSRRINNPDALRLFNVAWQFYREIT